MEIATFSAGCFWGVEEKFRNLKGVIRTEVGYIGGRTENPTYEEVCTKETGHAEAVRVTFDPDQISYEKLLEFFWKIHDPTSMNRQGSDVGDQYRSVIFYHNDDQRELAQTSKKKIQEDLSKPVLTSIEMATQFYRAEEPHQQYLKKKNELESSPKTQ